MKQRFTLLIIYILLFNVLQAQDPHYSQIQWMSPAANPSFYGACDCDYRAQIYHRSQWFTISAPSFLSYGMAFDASKFLPNGDKIGFGFTANYDEAGIASYKQTFFGGGASFSKKVAQGKYGRSIQYLIAGIQGGFGQYSLGSDNLWFTRQFDIITESVNPSFSSGEDFPNLSGVKSDMFLTMSAGLSYLNKFSNDLALYVSLSTRHLNIPNISFYKNEVHLLERYYSLQAGLIHRFNEEMSVKPNLFYASQREASEFILGSTVHYQNSDWNDIRFGVGLAARVTNRVDYTGMDAIIVLTELTYVDWTVGISYDISASSINNATGGNGAFELQLFYKGYKYEDAVTDLFAW